MRQAARQADRRRDRRHLPTTDGETMKNRRRKQIGAGESELVEGVLDVPWCAIRRMTRTS